MYNSLGWSCVDDNSAQPVPVNSDEQVTLNLGQNVTCTVTNDDASVVSRTQGFWSTHNETQKQWHEAVEPLFGVSVPGDDSCVKMGFHGMVPNLETNEPIECVDEKDALGGLWANLRKDTDGNKRPIEDKFALAMLQQLIAAMLNQATFGTWYGDYIEQGILAMADTPRK
jgi:hypothetical protein